MKELHDWSNNKLKEKNQIRRKKIRVKKNFFWLVENVKSHNVDKMGNTDEILEKAEICLYTEIFSSVKVKHMHNVKKEDRNSNK